MAGTQTALLARLSLSVRRTSFVRLVLSAPRVLLALLALRVVGTHRLAVPRVVRTVLGGLRVVRLSGGGQVVEQVGL